MGVVYRGVSAAGEPVAVKQIKAAAFASYEDRQRFAQEVEALQTVFGPRVVAFVDADPDAEQPWLAVEYVPGRTLQRYVADEGPLRPEMTAILGAALAEGLDTIHRAGLLHRDLKPQNIIVGPTGPRVIDFGLALFAETKVQLAGDGGTRRRLTASGMVVGTLVCMPPEQLQAKDLSPAADVYALGATLLYASTAHYPFDASGEFALMTAIASPETPPDLDGLAAPLVPVIGSMLAGVAADRPTLAEVARRLVEIVQANGLTATGARRRLIEVTTTPAERGESTEPEPPRQASYPRGGSATAGSRRRPTHSPARSRRVAERLRTTYARGSTL